MGGMGGTNVDWVHVSIVVRVHVAVGKQAIGEQREQHELGQRQELVARQGEARSSAASQHSFGRRHGGQGSPELQRDVLVGAGATQRVDRRTPARLGHLGDDARGTACRSHHVVERLEGAGSFAVRRRRLSVVEVLAAGAVLGVARKGSLGLRSSSSGSRRRGLGEGRGGGEGWRGVVLDGVAGLVACLDSARGREVERREGRRVR